jgi:DNA-binding MarR family transcriptional regulator
MPHLLLKNLPRYECLLEASHKFPELDPSACEAFLHLLRTGDEAFLYAEQNLTEHGISHGRFGVLMLLWGDCKNAEANTLGMTPAELADQSNVTRATMTGLIDTLVRDGFVKRSADTDDRRMMRVALTRKGENFLERLLPGHFQRMAALMDPLSQTERKTLVKLLNKVLQNASTLNAEPSVPAAAVR